MKRIFFMLGLFACSPKFQTIEASKAQQITPFDADGDGDLDLFFVDDANTLLFSIQDKRGFSTPARLLNEDNQAIQAEHLLLVDIDGDGVKDLLLAARRSGNVEFSRVVAGPAIEPLGIEADPSIDQASVGDITGDGRPDLILLRSLGDSQSSLDVFAQSADGSFAPFTSSVLPVDQNKLLIKSPIDVDNDSDLDLVGVSGTSIASPNVKLFINGGLGSFTLQDPSPSISEINSLEVSDLNGDGSPEILIFEDSFIDPTSLLLINNGAGNFTEERLSFEDLPLFQGATGDFNGDGVLDLISQRCRRGLIEGVTPKKRLQVSINDGSGNFTPGEDFSILDKRLLDLQVIDIDQDGSDEVVYTSLETAKIVIVDF